MTEVKHNVVVAVDPDFTDLDLIQKTLESWEDNTVYSWIDFDRKLESWIFGGSFRTYHEVYLFPVSRNHGHARAAFAFSRALWKKPAAVVLFRGPSKTSPLDFLSSIAAVGKIPIKTIST